MRVPRAVNETRVMPRHRQAVLDALADSDLTDADELAARVASAVLTAYDEKTRWVVATSEHVAFGPYATVQTAKKAIEYGLASRPGVQAMILPLKAAPTPTETSDNDRVMPGQTKFDV